jgi:hypothetical protein
MFKHYCNYLGGREPLGNMANLCLTTLETACRGSKAREKASKKYSIALSVLDRLGSLLDSKGGPDHARKAKGRSTPFNGSEIKWIEAAARAIIRRAAETAYDPQVCHPQITMADLPKLD